VLAFAAAHNASAAVRDDIAIAVSEACANVVMHAYARDPHPGSLTVEGYHSKGHLIVIDEGSGLEARSDSPGIGLGLSLMQRLTQRLEITDHSPAGTRVLMRFALAA
jgi:serine/threonine-protein kinase RsbW